MATARTTIELNGKLYDTRTGQVINLSQTAAKMPAPKKSTANHVNHPKKSSGVAVDGFVRRQASSQPQKINIAPAVPSKAASQHRQKPSTPRTKPAHLKTQVQKSQTLMRPAVKKPKKETEATVHAKYVRFKKHDPHRLTRASSVAKSELVRKFNFGAVPKHSMVKKEASLPVVSQASSATGHLSHQVAHLATSTEAHVKHSVDVIEESLRNATSHLEQFEDKVRTSFFEKFGFKNKFANITSLCFATLLLVGFFAYQNAPSIEMRIAAARSGVSAHMPGYSPAGFSATRNIQSEPGKVSVAFRSHTDDKGYNITQQTSNWSSDALLNNHVATTNQPYQTYESAGKKVYIFDNSNATWVNKGVWYQIDGDASLTSDQLLRIANSL